MKSGASKYALATEKQQFFSFPFPIRSSKGEISRQIPYLPLFCQLYLPRITFATTSLLMHLLCTTKMDLAFSLWQHDGTSVVPYGITAAELEAATSRSMEHSLHQVLKGQREDYHSGELIHRRS